MTNEEIAQVGHKMLDIFDKHGWCQRRLQTALGQVCLRGALFAALADEQTSVVRWPAYGTLAYYQFRAIDGRLEDFIEAEQLPLNPDDEDAPVAFNNSQHTTVEDVKLLIKRALIEPSLT